MEHLLACEGQLHRAVRDPRRQGGQHGVRMGRQLGAEAAADIAADDPDVVLRHVEHRGQDRLPAVQHLVGAEQDELAATPIGQRRVRLHHGMGLQGRRILHLDLHRCRRIRGVRVARRRVGRRVATILRGDGPVDVVGEGGIDGVGRVADLDRIGGGPRLLEGLGHHAGDGLAVMADAIVDEFGADLLALLPLFRGVAIGQHRDHAGHPLGDGGVERRDPALGDGGGHEVAVGDPLRLLVLVGVSGCAGDFRLAIDPVQGLADQPVLDRVEGRDPDGMRHVDHGKSPQAWVASATTDRSVRRVSGILKSLEPKPRAPRSTSSAARSTAD